MVITLKGEPQSTNNIYKIACMGKFPRNYMSANGKSLKEDYKWQIKSQWKYPKLEGDVSLEVKIYFGNKRKNDIDNFNKLWLDSFTGIVWHDDSQIIKIMIEKLYDKNNPRIEINI